jgi:hypothetical protein
VHLLRRLFIHYLDMQAKLIYSLIRAQQQFNSVLERRITALEREISERKYRQICAFLTPYLFMAVYGEIEKSRPGEFNDFEHLVHLTISEAQRGATAELRTVLQKAMRAADVSPTECNALIINASKTVATCKCITAVQAIEYLSSSEVPAGQTYSTMTSVLLRKKDAIMEMFQNHRDRV